MSNMGWALDFIGGNCLCRLAAGCRLLSEEMMQVLTLRQPAPGLTPNWAPLLRFFLFTNIATSKAVLCLVFTPAWEPRAGRRECRCLGCCLGPSVAALRLLQARTITGGRPRENWSNFHGSQNRAAPRLGLLVHCHHCVQCYL